MLHTGRLKNIYWGVTRALVTNVQGTVRRCVAKIIQEFFIQYLRGADVDSIAICYGIKPRFGARFSTPVHTGRGPTHHLTQWVAGFFHASKAVGAWR